MNKSIGKSIQKCHVCGMIENQHEIIHSYLLILLVVRLQVKSALSMEFAKKVLAII